MNQSKNLKPAYGYVLLWYGRKHTRVPLHLRAGARAQILMIRNYARKHGLKLAGIESEYLRRASEARDFTALLQLLERPSSEAPVVIIYDITRLLKRLPPDQLQEFVIELSPWLERLHDARLERTLDQVDGALWKHLFGIVQKQKVDAEVTMGSSRPRRSASPEQMRPAQARASRERTKRADESARMIGALRDELMAETPERKLTFAAIARAANERGLRTSRGAEWRSVQVSRALARLAEAVEA